MCSLFYAWLQRLHPEGKLRLNDIMYHSRSMNFEEIYNTQYITGSSVCVCVCVCLISLLVAIGLERTSYTTNEDSGTIQVCARLLQGSSEERITVDIDTIDDTAISKSRTNHPHQGTCITTVHVDLSCVCLVFHDFVILG